MKIVIIDGQGGKIGKTLIEQLIKEKVDAQIWAIGTNSTATAAMVKAGAHFGATGENPVLVNCRDADIIVGPIGIVIADALFGEVSPAMSVAIGQSQAHKVLLPINKCKNHIVSVQQTTVSDVVTSAINMIKEILSSL